MKESDIVYETDCNKYWVCKGIHGIGHYDVMKNVGTHSKRCGIVHYSDEPDKALKRAIIEADKRAIG